VWIQHQSHISVDLFKAQSKHYIHQIMSIQNKCYMRHKPYIKVYTKIWTIRVRHTYDQMRSASVVVSQEQRYKVLIDVYDTCNQSINIYTIVVVATFAWVKVWVYQLSSIQLIGFSQWANSFIFTVCLR